LSSVNPILSRLVDPVLGYKVFNIEQNLLDFVEEQVLKSINQACRKYQLPCTASSLSSVLQFLQQSPLYSGFTLADRTIPHDIVSDNSKYLRDQIGLSLGMTPDYLLNHNLYYRIVRTDVDSDISVVHRDIYFHNILPAWHPNPRILDLKLWIPLYLPSHSAIGVVPGSHLDAEYSDCSYEYLNGKKCSFKCSLNSAELTGLDVPVGSALLFPSSLLHGSLSSPYRAPIRLSAEFTLGFSI